MEKILNLILSEIQDVKQDMSVLKEDVTVLKVDMSELKEDVTVLKVDMSELKEDVAVLKVDVSELKEDVTVLKEDMLVVKDEMAVVEELKDGFSNLALLTQSIYHAVLRIEEGQPKDIYALLQGVHKRISKKDSEIAVLNRRMFKVEAEIEQCKKQ